MKTNRMFTVVRLAVLAVAVAGINAKAQDVAFHGKFTLTSETHWGITTLAAGNYTFTLDKAILNNVVTIQRGTKQVARIFSQGVSDVK